MSQILTVGSESLAAGFATGNNYTRTAERNRRLPLDERAPNVPFKFGLGFPQNFFALSMFRRIGLYRYARLH